MSDEKKKIYVVVNTGENPEWMIPVVAFTNVNYARNWIQERFGFERWLPDFSHRASVKDDYYEIFSLDVER